MGRAGDVRIRPSGHARAGLQHRHPTANGVGVAARWPRVLLHPHRSDRSLPADAGQARLLPDRLGRQRAADRATGTELLRCALRPERRVRPRLRSAGQAGPEAPGRDQPAQLHRAVPRSDAYRREDLRRAVAQGRVERQLAGPLHHHLRRLGSSVPARVPAKPGTRRGIPVRGADDVGRDVPDRRGAGRAGGTRLPGRLSQGVVPPDRRRRPGGRRDYPTGADRGLRGADRPSRRRALRRPDRHDGDQPGVRSRAARGDPRAGGAG